MTLSSKERAALRAEAHHLQPLVHVGHQGLTDALRQTLDDALRTHELVKVALAKSTDVSAKDISEKGRAGCQIESGSCTVAVSGSTAPSTT